MAKEEVIRLEKIEPKEAKITIRGVGDLIINKMDDPTTRSLIDQRKDKAKKVMQKDDEWERKITSVHWLHPLPDNFEFNEKSMNELLNGANTPCFSAFGFNKSLGEATVRFGVDQYATKIKACVNVVAEGGLVPFRFAGHYIDEKLMSPKKNSPVLTYQNRFIGWEADVTIRYIDTIYSLEQIVNIINLAGFGIGIGSGRSSGFGRYEVVGVV